MKKGNAVFRLEFIFHLEETRFKEILQESSLASAGILEGQQLCDITQPSESRNKNFLRNETGG